MIEYYACDTANEAFIGLITCLDAELIKRYGAAQAAYQPHNVIDSGEAIIASENGFHVGCGCFRPYDEDTVEIKRMYVRPEYRGRGVARELLIRLESCAKKKGYRSAVLETGRGQPEAIRLYEKSGYVRIPNYASYADMPESICFKKGLEKTDEAF